MNMGDELKESVIEKIKRMDTEEIFYLKESIDYAFYVADLYKKVDEERVTPLAQFNHFLAESITEVCTNYLGSQKPKNKLNQ